MIKPDRKPSWNGVPDVPFSPELLRDAVDLVVSTHLRDDIYAGGLSRRTPDELRHLLEAAAWVRRVAELIELQAAAVWQVRDGASHADVAAATGRSRSTISAKSGRFETHRETLRWISRPTLEG